MKARHLADRSRWRELAITLACRTLTLLLRPWTRRRTTAGTDPARILVLRRCCFGDVLMITPLLAALDAAYPQATITVAVGRWSAGALAHNPQVDRTIVLPDAPTIRQWIRIVGRLRRECVDLAVLPERSPLVPVVAALAGIPRRVGFDSASRGFALTDPVPVHGVRHETDRALDLARALGIAIPTRRPDYHPGVAARERVREVLDRQPVQVPLFVLHPGGGANPGVTMDAKRWPPERFAQVADALLARHGGTLVLTGAASDRPAVNATLAALQSPAIDLCGLLNVDEHAALCQHAALYLGNDSGVTHLAEACGAPTVVVFGPTDPAQYGPVDGIGEAVWDPLACGPSVRHGDLTRSPGTDDRCIDAIAVDQVLAAAERVLTRARQHQPLEQAWATSG